MLYDFPKVCHLRKNWEYQRVWKMGCKLHTPHFILLVADNTAGNSRLGLTVSRKVGNAVIRNRIKRFIREFFRQQKLNFLSDVDFSVIAKKGAAGLTIYEVHTELRRVFDSRQN